MTRAIDRLIVSGAIDPDRQQDRETPIGWVLGAARRDGELERREPVELERGDARFVLARRPLGAAAVRREPELPAGRRRGPARALRRAADRRRRRAATGCPSSLPLPAPPLHRVRRLSYSALALFERCSYRYYAERVAGLREERGTRAGRARRLEATEIGDAVHRLLELVDLRAPVAPDVEIVRDVVPGGDRRGARADRRLRRGVLRAPSSPRGSRRSRARGRSGRSRSSTTACCCTGGSTCSGAKARERSSSTTRRTRSPRERRTRSSRPTTACSGSSTRSRASAPGADEVEVVYHFLERPDAVVSTTFDRSELPALEAELSAAIARIDAGEFVPTPSEFTCSGCPALDLVCAGRRALRRLASRGRRRATVAVRVS